MGQDGLQVHGAADWQPQPQVDGVAAGVRQPQVQDSPMQGLQEQGAVSVFMWISLVGVGWIALRIHCRRVLNIRADLSGSDHGQAGDRR